MTKNVGLTYVKEFEFPAEQGFTGSAGRSSVRGYMRGGHVKAEAGARRKASGANMPATVKSHGGTVGVTTTQSKKMPQKARQAAAAKKSAKKGHGGGVSMNDKLYAAGEQMGYAKGGYASMNTDAEFLMKTSKQDTMDHGIYPAQSTTQADKEAGGRPRLKPKFKYGGKVHAVRDVKAKSRRKASKRGMPKNVKNRGGLARYSNGGYTSEERSQKRGRKTLDEALAASNLAMGVKDKPPEPSTTSATPKVESWAMPRAYDKDFKISHAHATGGSVKKRGAAR
jgi:hypothetical protein